MLSPLSAPSYVYRAGCPGPCAAATLIAQECLQPGVLMASVVLPHGINANLVQNWIGLIDPLTHYRRWLVSNDIHNVIVE